MILAASLAVLVAAAGGDADRPGDSDIPQAAKSSDDIVAAAEKVKGFGIVNTAEFRCDGKHSFALWYCPFSGIGDCYLHIYYLVHLPSPGSVEG
jgi:hypothetical protein